jgi:hypothetical protein
MTFYANVGDRGMKNAMFDKKMLQAVAVFRRGAA